MLLSKHVFLQFPLLLVRRVDLKLGKVEVVEVDLIIRLQLKRHELVKREELRYSLLLQLRQQIKCLTDTILHTITTNSRKRL